MTQEEKQLLLKDLCARLQHGVIIIDVPANHYGKVFLISTTDTVQYETEEDSYTQTIYNIKPYLRPMSSMTKEEKKDWMSLMRKEYREQYPHSAVDTSYYEYFPTIESFDYLNSNHFDYRGLIPMGLAFEAPEGMYKNE